MRHLIKKSVNVALALSLFMNGFVSTAAHSQETFFRYKGTQMVSWSPDDETITDPINGYDVYARFTSMVDHDFAEPIPLKPGKEVSFWKIEGGRLPDGITLDPATGIISGRPSRAQTTVARIDGVSPNGNDRTTTSITVEVVEASAINNVVSYNAHVDRDFSFNLRKGNVVVNRWEAVKVPSWAVANSPVFLTGTPPAGSEGVHDIELIGYDYRDQIVTITKGVIHVTDSPVITHIPDYLRHPESYFDIPLRASHNFGSVKWSVEGSLPNALSLSHNTSSIRGRIPTFETSSRIRVAARDIDGTVGYSNWFTVGTTEPESALNPAADRYAFVGVPVGFGFLAEDIPEPRVWEITEGSLPPGLSLNASTGRISGTPTIRGIFSDIVISATNSSIPGATGTSSPFAIHVSERELIASVNPSNVRINTPFTTDAPTVENAIGAVSFAMADGASLGEGLTLDLATGQISGEVSQLGNHSQVIIASDANGNRSRPLTVGITAYAPLSIAMNAEYRGNRGTEIDEIIPTVDLEGFIPGPETPYNLIGTLPNGLQFDGYNGSITGIPTVAGTFPGLQISISDATQTAYTDPFRIVIADRLDPAVSVSDINLLVGDPVSTAFATAENTIGALSWSMSGVLPDGLTATNSGILSGIPTAAGVYGPFVATVTDGEGATSSSSPFSITVTDQPAMTVGETFTWSVGKPFSHQLTAGNAIGNPTWLSSNIPSGISLSPGGVISGTVSTVREYSFNVTITDESGRSASGVVEVHIKPVMTMAMPSIVIAPEGESAIIRPTVANGIEPITFTQTGTLPTGLSFFPSGSIEGTPTQIGSRPITIQAVDATGTSISVSSTIDVTSGNSVYLRYDFSAPLNANSSLGLPKLPTTSGILAPATYSLDGELPLGITFDTVTGAFTGVPQESGLWDAISVTVTDANDVTATTSVTITVLPSGNISASNKSASSRVGEFFSVEAPSVRNAVGQLSFTVESSQVSGISLDASTGLVTGVASSDGLKSIVVRVTDAMSRSTTYRINIEVVGLLSLSYEDQTLNRYQNHKIIPDVINVAGSATYTLATGTLPNGMTLDPSTGVISGTPTSEGTSSGIRIRVEDEGVSGNSATSEIFSIVVGPRLPLEASIEEENLIIANVPYSLRPVVSNSYGAVTYTLSGTLPAGLTFNSSTGTISGTVTSIIRSEGHTITVRDAGGGNVTTSQFALQSVTNGLPIILRTYTGYAKPGVEFSTKLPKVENAVGTIEFQAPDALALGLSVNLETGVITGTLPAEGDYTINLRVMDSSNRLTSKPVTIKVLPPIRVDIPSRFDFTEAQSVGESVAPIVTNAVGSVSFQLIGNLPTGLTFSTYSGDIRGVPTVLGLTENLVIKATDATGDYAYTEPFRIEVHSDGVVPRLTVPVMTTWREGTSVSYQLTHTPTKTGAKYSVNKPLPEGVTLNENTGVISGIPAAGSRGIYTDYVFTVTDQGGLSGHGTRKKIVVQSTVNITLPNQELTLRTGEPFQTLPIEFDPAGAVGEVRFEQSGTGWTRAKIDPETGAIRGTGPITSTNLTYKLFDEVGEVATARLEITKVNLSVSVSRSNVRSDHDFITPEPTLTNARGKVTYNIQSGTLPTGARLDTDTGQIYGSISGGVSSSMTIRATDDFGNGTSGSFILSSYAQADPVTFINVSDVELSATNIDHEAVRLTGFTGSISVKVTGHSTIRYALCSSASCSGVSFKSANTFTANAGQYLKLRFTNSGTGLNTTRSSTITIGEDVYTWSITTRPADTVPDQFEFIDAVDQTPGATVTSQPVLLTGFTESASMRITHNGSNLQHRLCTSSTCGSTFTPGGSASVGAGPRYLFVRIKASSTPGGVVTVNVDVGGTKATWTVTTAR